MHSYFVRQRAILCVLVFVLSTLWAVAAMAQQAMPLGINLFYYTGQHEGREQKLLLALVEPAPGYYIYAHHGDNAKPTLLRLHTEPGKSVASSIRYPQGATHKDVFTGKPVMAYTGPTPLFTLLPEVFEEPLFVEISGLLCSDKHCIPFSETRPVNLAAQFSPLEQSPWQQAFTQSLPAQFEAPETLRHNGPLPSLAPVLGIRTLGPGAAQALGPQPVAQPAGGWQFSPQSAQQGSEPQALASALLFGLLAGFVLNLMPCVLPVLTLKTSGLLHSGSGSPQERQKNFRLHNMLFAAGIISCFALLALLVGVFGLAWGELFQQPLFVLGMLLVVFALSMSLFGAFTLPILDFKQTSTANPHAQTYATGFAATLLATPCSGPLLGGVLAWSVQQPILVLVLTFLSTGFGMALPYVCFALWPQSVRFIPKPGPWLMVLEKTVAVLLLGTVAYLASIVPYRLGLWLVLLLPLGAMAFAIKALWRESGQQKARALAKAAIGCVAFAALLYVVVQPTDHSGTWEAFDAAQFRRQLGTKPMLLQFTADWCPNCKVLEHTTLSPARVQRLAAAHGLTLVRVDITRTHPEAESLLKALGSISIPLTAIFPAGEGAAKPFILRDVYTPQTLRNALARALP